MCGLILSICLDVIKAVTLDAAVQGGDQLKSIWKEAVMIMRRLENVSKRGRVTRMGLAQETDMKMECTQDCCRDFFMFVKEQEALLRFKQGVNLCNQWDS